MSNSIGSTGDRGDSYGGLSQGATPKIDLSHEMPPEFGDEFKRPVQGIDLVGLRDRALELASRVANPSIEDLLKNADTIQAYILAGTNEYAYATDIGV